MSDIPVFMLDVNSHHKAVEINSNPELWGRVVAYFKLLSNSGKEAVINHVGEEAYCRLRNIVTFFYLADTEERETINVLNRVFDSELDLSVC